jgi:hypothetical protein
LSLIGHRDNFTLTECEVRAPVLTPLDFSVRGYVKNKVFVPPLPASLEEQRAQITEAVAIDVDMIHRTWDEIA